MHKEKLSYGLLLETSKKMQMPFADLLGGVVLEDIIARIAGSANKENFWLRNSNVIGKEQYQKNLVLHLEYDYVIGKLKKADPEKNEQTLLMDLARQLETIFADTESGVSYRMKKQVQKQDLRIQLNARIEEMQIPVSLKIHLMFDEKKIPKKESFMSIVFPKTEVTYYSYPVEAFLAENFIEAVVKLELIQDMKVYYDIYYLLERESVDGRKVKDYIDEECENKQIKKEADMVVLAAAIEPDKSARPLATMLTASMDTNDFFTEAHPKLRPVESPTAGVFLSGMCQGPKDIPETVAQASAAAAKVIGLLCKDSLTCNPCVAQPDEMMCNGCSNCEKVCPYGAITYIDKEFRGPNRTTLIRRVAQVNPAVCQGCGACTVACMSGAMDLKGFSNRQIMAEVDAICR